MKIENEELFIIDYKYDDSKRMLYVPKRDMLSLVDNEIAQNLINFKHETIKGFLEYVKKKPLLKFNNSKNQIPCLIIPISNKCNLKCAYCYNSERGEQFTKEKIGIIISAYIKKYFAQLEILKIMSIEFGGGYEPTCEPELLRYAVDKTKQALKDTEIVTRFSMITNACFDIEIMNFLIENEFSLRISLDGPKEISEKQRNSNGQFDKIIENVKYLLENSLKIQFRLTATSLTKIYYKEVIDFFYENFGNCILQISPVSFLGNACENPNLFLSEEDYFVLIEKMTDYAGDRLTVNINGMCGFAENRKYYCNAINARQLVIKPDGIITSCTRDGKGDYFKIGTFDYKGAEFHMEGNAQKHIENTYNIDNISECNDCFAKSVCLGGCPMDRATDNKIHCDTIKGNLKEKLSLLIYKR